MNDLEPIQTSVLIVGGGPVGLAMAVELGQLGVPSVLVEQRLPSAEIQAKAGSVSYRSVEYCRRWGILNDVYNCGFPDDYQLDQIFCTDLGGFELGRNVGPSMATFVGPEATPVRRQRCPQMWFDPILRREAERLECVRIIEGTRVTGVEQTNDAVHADLAALTSGLKSSLDARYAVLCEGAEGSIRQSLSMSMSGTWLLNYSISILIRCPKFRQSVKFGDASRYILVGTEGTWGNFTVIDGTEYWRLTLIWGKEKVDLEAFDAHSWVKRALGDLGLEYEIISVQPWRRSAMVADAYRLDNVFLAGDSAHTMSNTGGFGMNTGLGDVVNLGWKLAATLAGWGGERLLDTYDQERRPVAWRNIRFSNKILDAWMSDDAGKQLEGALTSDSVEAESIRRAIGARFVAGTHSEWATLGAALGYRYEGSRICIPDGTPPTEDDVEDYIPTARPGSRAPHAWIGPDHSLLDHFKNSYTLLCFKENATSHLLIEEAWRSHVPIKLLEVTDSQAAKIYEASLVLVRPDGHVAWRGDIVKSTEAAHEIVATIRGGS